MNTPTPTPRTDAAWSETFDGEQMSAGRTARALRECSQQLETELAALTAECDQLRADCENETKWAAHYLAQSIADKARAERAEDNLAALEQCHDDNCRGVVKIADELATERARLADLVADLNDACITLESAKDDCDDYAMQNTAFKLMAVRDVLLQYIPNAAMKEDAK